MIITLKRKITGKELIQDFKHTYGTIENLKKLIENEPGNPLYTLDLDDWKYYLKQSEGPVKERQIIFAENFDLKMSDLRLLDKIKQKKPKSVDELAEIMQKDVKEIYPRLEKLEKVGFIILHKCPGDVVIPALRYDALTIEI